MERTASDGPDQASALTKKAQDIADSVSHKGVVLSGMGVDFADYDLPPFLDNFDEIMLLFSRASENSGVDLHMDNDRVTCRVYFSSRKTSIPQVVKTIVRDSSGLSWKMMLFISIVGWCVSTAFILFAPHLTYAVPNMSRA